MALEAIDKRTGKTIYLWKLNDKQIGGLASIFRGDKDNITCVYPDCNCRMYIKAVDSKNVVAHFARYPKTGNDDYHSGGESIEHLLAKFQLAGRLQADHPDSLVTTEHMIRGEMKNRKFRKVDIFVTHPDGKTEAHEIQLSRQTVSITEERTRDYAANGVDEVVWWWGKSNSERRGLIDWCLHNTDKYGTVATDGSQCTLVAINCKKQREVYHEKWLRDQERLRVEHEHYVSRQRLIERYHKLCTQEIPLIKNDRLREIITEDLWGLVLTGDYKYAVAKVDAAERFVRMSQELRHDQ